MSDWSSVAGKYCLVTGATSGIGRATAKGLAEQGAKLTIVCRSQSKGDALCAELAQFSKEPVELIIGDLASLEQVRDIARQYLDKDQPLHLLVNNAGVVNTQRQLTIDGFEETFAVNHLAYFLLTNLLLERIKASAPARIVNVASDAYTFVRDMGWEDLAAEREYKTFTVYGRSKLANILFTRELARRLRDSSVTVNCLHPGAVSTGLGTQNNGLLGKVLPVLLKPFFKTPEQGAATSLYLATSPAVNDISGAYFSNCRQAKLKPWATDDEAAARLWQLSAEMVAI